MLTTLTTTECTSLLARQPRRSVCNALPYWPDNHGGVYVYQNKKGGQVTRNRKIDHTSALADIIVSIISASLLLYKPQKHCFSLGRAAGKQRDRKKFRSGEAILQN